MPYKYSTPSSTSAQQISSYSSSTYSPRPPIKVQATGFPRGHGGFDPGRASLTFPAVDRRCAGHRDPIWPGGPIWAPAGCRPGARRPCVRRQLNLPPAKIIVVVCPAKADTFSGRQSRQGKSQSLVARMATTSTGRPADTSPSWRSAPARLARPQSPSCPPKTTELCPLRPPQPGFSHPCAPTPCLAAAHPRDRACCGPARGTSRIHMSQSSR